MTEPPVAPEPALPRALSAAAEEPPARIGRNVVVLSWVSFFQDAASELLYPVLPLFLTGVLGAPPAVVGLIEGIAEGTASVMKAVSGRLADYRRRRPLVGLGYGIAAVAKVLIALATVWPMVLAARVIDRIGKGIRTSPRDALIAADTPPELRGRAFGFHRAADTAGAVLGPLLGLLLYESLHHHLRPMFWVAVVPAAVSVALVPLVREAKAPLPKRQARGGAEPVTHLPQRYWRVVAFLALFGLANFSDAFVILRAKHLGLGVVAILLVYAAYNASYAALSYPAGRLSDRVPRHLVFALGLAVFAVSYLGLGLVTTAGWVWVLLPLYGAYTALTDGVGKAWIADQVPASRLGSGLGVYQAIAGGASLVAGIWAGLSWGGSGRLPFLVAGAAAAVLALALALDRGMRAPVIA